MAQTPNKKNSPRKKSPRKHVPALDAKSLRIALEDLQALNVNDHIKRSVGDIFKAASNHDHGKPEVIVKSLPKERQKLINKTIKGVKAISDGIMARGKKGLLDMPDDEWNNLVEQVD